MSTDVVGTIGSGAGKIGRYFTVVSALPAAVFVSYVYLLVRTGAWSGPVRWSALAEFRPQDLLVLGIAAFVLAIATNPLQYPMVQLLEGYWGASPFATRLALIRTTHHRRRMQALKLREAAAKRVLSQYKRGILKLETAPTDVVHSAIVVAESQRAGGSYPVDLTDVLPTRLGNVLRRYETSVGKPYRLDPLISIPRLAMVGSDREVGYVQNQRVQMELATRTAWLGLVAALVTVVLMWRQGFWLLLALAPYAVAFLAYRGAVAIAHEYGTSLAVLTELSRFALYERLRLPPPDDTVAERRTNETLMKLFRFDDESVPYAPPPPPGTICITGPLSTTAPADGGQPSPQS